MNSDETLDSRFREAVACIDAGDAGALGRLVAAHPQLVRERLESPGPWLRERVGAALDGFFKRPYLLWFVAEDPVRNGKLPANIVEVARAIIDAARRDNVSSLKEQLDYALSLVCWSWIARECGVQIELIDVLLEAGASADGNPENALVNGNVAAADHLVQRGAKLSLATALCLGRWDDVARLGPTATDRDKRFACALSALQGKADALRRLVDLGVEVSRPSEDLYSHGTPLHHAVSSASLESVKVLVESGADIAARDTNWKKTPLQWAEYAVQQAGGRSDGKAYPQIAEYLRAKESQR
jgi:peptide-methionine (S)-S-oxide reductase